MAKKSDTTRSTENESRNDFDKQNAEILWFKDLYAKDIDIAGGKGANLGEMTQNGVPVPPGFVITVSTYRKFLTDSNLEDKIKALLIDLDVNNSKLLGTKASEIQSLIISAPLSKAVEVKIEEAYKFMGEGLVAVRSSATAEDLPDASFAGQQSTYLNVDGIDQVIDAVKGCWASLFEARAIFYREEQNFDQLSVGIAVPVQRMVQSEISGVMFTVEPTTSDRGKVLVEAIYGLGEGIVSGEITPDTYMIDKSSLSVTNRQHVPQTWMLVRNMDSTNRDDLNKRVEILNEQANSNKLDDSQIQSIVELGLGLEKAYNSPQDIEWAYQDGKFYIIQTRPITTLTENNGSTAGLEVDENEYPLLLSGAPASPGAASGRVVIVENDDMGNLDRIQQGDILVTEMTTPDFVPAMKRASAIVTDQGGRTAHAAIISRELGIPCVVGTGIATEQLASGEIITVDGSSGRVYKGAIPDASVQVDEYLDASNLKTRTNIYVNLAEPDLAEVVAASNVDGIGLLRAEFIVARIGEHPRLMLEEGRGSEFTEKLAEGLTSFAAAFDPRPVIYRATDFKTNEYRNLRGGDRFEPEEENPMIGYRGAARYIKEPDLFAIEIEAVKQVREKYKNLHVMIPFVRTVDELVHTKSLLEQYGLKRGEDGFKLWMMAEVPSNVLLLDKFIDVGIDGVSIGSNDLTQLVLGVDRDSATLVQDFDERNEAVMYSLEHIITTAKKRGITCSICGQAPSFFPDLTAKLVEWGITSVSVSPDVINKTRQIVFDCENN
jgi:pyruvate,water dikinase